MKVPTNTVKICRNFMLSSGVVVGTVYYFQQAGVWGTPEETAGLYDAMRDRLKPHAAILKDHIPEEILNVENMIEIRGSLRNHFNNGVKKSFSFMQMMPTHVGSMGKRFLETCNEKRFEFLEFTKTNRESDGEISDANKITSEKKINEHRDDHYGINHENDKVLQIGEDGAEKKETNKRSQLLLSTFM